MNTKIRKSGLIAVTVVLLTILLILPAAADDNQTEVKATVGSLTIGVDDTISGWGYSVKVDGNTEVSHTEKTCTVSVSQGEKTAGGSLVQILVNGTTGLQPGWDLEVTSENCTYEIPENEIDPNNQNLVKVYDFTAGTASVSITAVNTNKVTVTFDAAGGSPTPEAQTVYSGQTITEPASPTLSRYTFLGWYNGSTKWNFTTDVVTSNMTLKASWRYNGGGGGGGGGSVTPVPVTPVVVDEVEEEVVLQDEIVVSEMDEDGNVVDLPVEKLIMSDKVTGTVDLKDMTDYYNSLPIVPSLQETAQYISEYRVETIEEAEMYGIPVYENYIGGNGHAPVLTEESSVSDKQVQFWKVVEITTDVTGGELQEIIFSVPLDELKELGYTMNDVVLYHGVTENGQRTWYPLVTTQEWFDDQYVYYKAVTDGASPFGIMFLKDSTSLMPVTEDLPDEPVTPTPASTPLGLVAVLAGLGAAVSMIRRK